MKIFIAQHIKSYKLAKGVKSVNLIWKNNTITDWVNTNININNKTVLTGHSIGASVALILAQKNTPKELHLYSPAPIFKDSLPLLNKSMIKYLGKKRITDIKNNFPIKNVKCPVKIYLGSEEIQIMTKNAKLIQKKIPHAKLVIIKGKNHYNII